MNSSTRSANVVSSVMALLVVLSQPRRRRILALANPVLAVVAQGDLLGCAARAVDRDLGVDPEALTVRDRRVDRAGDAIVDHPRERALRLVLRRDERRPRDRALRHLVERRVADAEVLVEILVPPPSGAREQRDQHGVLNARVHHRLAAVQLDRRAVPGRDEPRLAVEVVPGRALVRSERHGSSTFTVDTFAAVMSATGGTPGVSVTALLAAPAVTPVCLCVLNAVTSAVSSPLSVSNAAFICVNATAVSLVPLSSTNPVAARAAT